MSAEYTYRRKLRATELMPALGAGIGFGLATFYIVRLLLQRTPVVPRSTEPRPPARSSRSHPARGPGT